MGDEQASDAERRLERVESGVRLSVMEVTRLGTVLDDPDKTGAGRAVKALSKQAAEIEAGRRKLSGPLREGVDGLERDFAGFMNWPKPGGMRSSGNRRGSTTSSAESSNCWRAELN